MKPKFKVGDEVKIVCLHQTRKIKEFLCPQYGNTGIVGEVWRNYIFGNVYHLVDKETGELIKSCTRGFLQMPGNWYEDELKLNVKGKNRT